MLKRVASIVFLLVGVIIGLGAFGHGSAASRVHAAIDQFPIDHHIHATLYIVWYFVSGCMLAFGAIIIWVWLRLRSGDAGHLFAAISIGILYLATGIGASLYEPGQRFWMLFVTLGGLLLICAFVLRRGKPQVNLQR
jgi:hypothetical protein